MFCLENSKARSNEFAEKNGLQKYEYVLHPRTTGFTFVVDRLREGKHPPQSILFHTSGKMAKLYIYMYIYTFIFLCVYMPL